MSNKTLGAACAAGFFLVMIITLIFPSFPPARLIYDFLKIPQNNTPVLGIPTTVLIDGVTNGLFWLVVSATAYGLVGFSMNDDSLPPLPEMPRLEAPPPEPTRVDNRTVRIPPALTVRKPRKRKPRTEYDVETIEGIGPVRGEMLRNIGVKTVDDLLKVAATKRGQLRLAQEVGVSHEMMLKWIAKGDLLRIEGVGAQYSGLLEAAGVNSVTDLSSRNPGYLHQTLRNINKEKKMVKRVPPHRTVQIWVDEAKDLIISESRV
jgi:predicted flap endonuclease-1-like 5' DNA nuclease